MEQFVAALSALRSPKLAAIGAVACLALLFFPYGSLGLSEPSFILEYEAVFVTIGVLCSAVLVIEILCFFWQLLLYRLQAIERRKVVREIFENLNHLELCIVLMMIKGNTLVIKGSMRSHTLISMHVKGALTVVPGIQTLTDSSHAIPTDLFDYAAKHIDSRIDSDFLSSPRLEDELRERVERAIR